MTTREQNQGMLAARRNVSRRTFLRAMGGAAGAALLAACGGTPAAPSGEQPAAGGAAPAAGGAAGEVQFWDMVWGPPEYIDTSKKTVEQFNTANPSIKVNYQSNPWSSWPQVFTTAVGSGTAPDISTGGGYQAIQFYPQGAILEIDDVIAELKSTGKLDDFAAGHVESMNFNGHYIGLPWGIDIRVPFIRKDMFDAAGVKPPTTWDELRAALKNLTSGDKYGIAFAGNNPLGWQAMFALVMNNGGGLFNEAGKLDVMNDRNVEAFTFIADLIKDGVVHPGSAGFAGADMEKAFASGNAAMMFNGPGGADNVAAVKDKTDLLAPMTGPHGEKGTLAFSNNLMIYKQTKNPGATKTFLKWWSENSLPNWTQGHCGNLPVRKSIAKDAYFQSNVYLKRTLDEYVPIGKLTGNKAPGTFPALADIDAGGMLNTLATDILQGMDVKAALTKCETTLKGLKTLQQ
jgi:multiple sugar transport system substrate-binding protein